MTRTDVILGVLAPALQAWIAAILLYRRLYRTFPFFSAYTFYSIGVIFVRVLARASTRSYFVLYSVTEILYGCLALLAIREAFKYALESYYDRHRWTRTLPGLIVALLIGLPAYAALHGLQGEGDTLYAAFSSGVYSFMLLIRSIEVFVFGLYLSRSRHYDIGGYNAGIVKGFGVYALVTLLAYFVHYYGGRFEGWYRYMAPGSYCTAAAIWLTAFLPTEQPKTPPNTEHLKKQLTGAETLLEHYSEILRKILHVLKAK